jgi:hypothetical protein
MMKLYIPEPSRVICSAVLYIVKLKNEDFVSNTAERGSGGQLASSCRTAGMVKHFKLPTSSTENI